MGREPSQVPSCSVSRSGNVWDNSAMESFSSTLKIERVRRRVYATRYEDEGSLGYLSPAEYEKSAGSA